MLGATALVRRWCDVLDARGTPTPPVPALAAGEFRPGRGKSPPSPAWVSTRRPNRDERAVSR